MTHTFTLDPAKMDDAELDGTICAMVEMLILMAFHHGASRLEFRTIDGEFRVAEIIDNRAYEFPQPPGPIQKPIVDHMRTIFLLSGDSSQSEALLRVGASVARARCEITNHDQDATVAILAGFDPPTDLRPAIARFWRKQAVDAGIIALARYCLKNIYWRIEELANHAMNRSRGSTGS